MILTCPSCGTQYVVKDGAVPPGGRQVRCAACKHSWHQDPETSAEPVPQSVEEAPVETPSIEPASSPGDEEESVAEATLIEPRSGPEIEERAYEEAAMEEAQEAPADQLADEATPASEIYPGTQFDIEKKDESEAVPASDWSEPPQAEAVGDEFTPYPAADELEPRRRSPVLAVLIIVIIVIALAAAFWFLAPPDLKARLGLAGVSTSPLALITTHMDRQRLESGNELLTVTGRVINPTGRQQDVPPLQAQLKTRAGKVVYTWVIAPPARSLGPGASASFNSAEVNVPAGGDELTITLGAGGAG